MSDQGDNLRNESDAEAVEAAGAAAEAVGAVEAAGAAAEAKPEDQSDELARAEERLHAVEAELEAARARVAELRRDASYPQPPLSGEGGSSAAEGFASAPPAPDPAPYVPPSYAAYSQQSQQAASPQHAAAPFGAAQPYAQQPYAAQQPYGAQQAYGASQQPYGGSQPQQPYGAPQSQQPFSNIPYTPPSYAQPAVTKDHVAAGLLAIFLGVFGVHKFYLGYNTAGFIMLAVTILGSIFTFGLAAGVMWVIALIEGIIYLVKSQSEFDAVYVANKKEWF